MRRFADWWIFAGVLLWVLVRYPREYRRLIRRQWVADSVRINPVVPVTANEKYVWRKLFDHDPRFVTCCDKLATKSWARSLGLDVDVPRTLWEGTDPGAIPPEVLQGDVLVKSAHGNGTNVYVSDGVAETGDLHEGARAALAQDHGRSRNEWGYFDVPRRIFVEERLFPGRPFTDMKIYTYGAVIEQLVPIYNTPGQPRAAAIWEVRKTGGFDLSDVPTAVTNIIDDRPLPENLPRMLALSAQIGRHFDHVRVDFLTDGTDLYLGELTIYNLGGRTHWTGTLIDTPLNRSWDLRRSWFLSVPQRGWRAMYAAALRRAITRQAARRPRLDLAGPVDPACLPRRD